MPPHNSSHFSFAHAHKFCYSGGASTVQPLNASYSDKLQFVGASVDDKPELARELLKKREWNATTNVWLDANAIKALHINSVPVTYLIDSEGKIIANSEDKDFQAILAKLIDGISSN